MKNLYTFVFWLLVPAFCLAQTPCPLYQKYMDKGNAAVKAERFEEAINAFSAAMLHCPDQADESQQKIIEVFNRINQLKIDAQKAKIKAENAQKETEIALQKAENAQKETELALLKADSAIAEIARREIASARAELDKVRPQTAFGHLVTASFSKNPQIKAQLPPLMAEIAFLELHQKPVKAWPNLESLRVFQMREGTVVLIFEQNGKLFDQALREAQKLPNKTQARAHVLSAMEQKLGTSVIQSIRDKYYSTKKYTDSKRE
ncbi:MAG: hypothetical protein NW226_13410 [Microscillaceae bacterium]|nr:hypothetical protein [Microscillaceae bacterium]